MVVPDIIGLLPTLKDSHAYTAIEALGRLGTAAARQAVESYAGHPSPQLRKFVIEALTRIQDPSAEATLERMSREDSVAWVRDLAKRRMKRRF